MAQDTTNERLTIYNIYPTDPPLGAFDRFLQEKYEETIFFAKNGEEKCFLDFMLVWLIEGDGAQQCTTFDSWLRAIIHFANTIFSPNAPEPGRYGSLEQPGIATFWRLAHSKKNQMGLLDPTQAPTHPALNREIYEHYRHKNFVACQQCHCEQPLPTE